MSKLVVITDPFTEFLGTSLLARRGQEQRKAPSPVNEKIAGGGAHCERAHSKFSASGSERWFECPGSVNLSEGIPDKSSIWAEEGTKAHEVLEAFLNAGIEYKATGKYVDPTLPAGWDHNMVRHAKETVQFILRRHASIPDSELLVETRIYLDFIHKEMFGTFDSAIVDHFGNLDVIDYKYGAGVPVSPVENLQMIFYGIGVAHQFNWNFKTVSLWIIQPRIKGYDGPVYWQIPIARLKEYVSEFSRAVERVLTNPEFREGSWCHWCKAKKVCPLKQGKKEEQARALFGSFP